jgi:pantoate--beta-alanine ligase
MFIFLLILVSRIKIILPLTSGGHTMKQFSKITEIANYLSTKKKDGFTIGFVPTMGALHEGHLNLVKRSKRENDLTVCSIFVNPIQFNNAEDLTKYPRTPEQDLKVLEDNNCDVVFTPDRAEMYPEEEISFPDIEFGILDKVMEGKFRPGHFKGVAIVVKKLFDIVQPTRAYFGKKDFQQLAIIKFMVEKLALPVNIIPCETIRETDGLAMSSRNTRLTRLERDLAPKIYQVLCCVKEKADKMPAGQLIQWAVTEIQKNMEFRVEYIEIGDKDSLMPLQGSEYKDRAVVFAAVFLGEVRLIDNIELFS